MAQETPCQISGAIYSIAIMHRGVSVSVEFPPTVLIPLADIETVEARQHRWR